MVSRPGGVSELRDILNELVEHGANLDYADQKGWTAFHYACDGGERDKVMILVHAGCDTGARTPTGETGWERAQQYSQRAPTPARQAGCEAVAKFLESVARKGTHVNLRFEWGRQMIEEGARFEAERQWTSAHSAYKIGAARLNHRSAQLSARAQVLLLATIGQFGPAPQPEPEVVEIESVDRVPVPAWVHPAQRAALRQALFDGVHSGAAKEAEKRAAERREVAVAARKAKEKQKADQLAANLEAAQVKERARRHALAAAVAEKAEASAQRELHASQTAEQAAIQASEHEEDEMARCAHAARKAAEDAEKEAELRKPHAREKLFALNMRELLVCASHAGATEEDLEVACDSDDPKEAVVQLYYDAVAKAEQRRLAEAARATEEEERRKEAAAAVAAERAALRAEALDKQQRRAAEKAAEAERLDAIAFAEEREAEERAAAVAKAQLDQLARDKRRGWWSEGDVTYIRGLAFLQAIDEWGYQEIAEGNGITEEDVAGMPQIESVTERRRRRQRIKDADATARSALRELFLSSWGGRPIQDIVTLQELHVYANEWLMPAPPLIETEAATAIAQLSPNLASVPADLLHCLQRVEEHLREDQAKVFSQTLMDQQRQMAEWTAALYGGGGRAPVPKQLPVQEWAQNLAPNSRYRQLAVSQFCHILGEDAQHSHIAAGFRLDTFSSVVCCDSEMFARVVQAHMPPSLTWQPPRSPAPTQALPKKLKRGPPPQRLVASLGDRLQVSGAKQATHSRR